MNADQHNGHHGNGAPHGTPRYWKIEHRDTVTPAQPLVNRRRLVNRPDGRALPVLGSCSTPRAGRGRRHRKREVRVPGLETAVRSPCSGCAKGPERNPWSRRGGLQPVHGSVRYCGSGRRSKLRRPAASGSGLSGMPELRELLKCAPFAASAGCEGSTRSGSSADVPRAAVVGHPKAWVVPQQVGGVLVARETVALPDGLPLARRPWCIPGAYCPDTGPQAAEDATPGAGWYLGTPESGPIYGRSE